MSKKGVKDDVIHLFLKHKWYDMIERGEKKEEYREIKPYWIGRIFKEAMSFPKGIEPHDFFFRNGKYHGIFRSKVRLVVFHRAYTDTTMEYKVDGIAVGKPNPEWCESEDKYKEVFIIKLGKRIR